MTVVEIIDAISTDPAVSDSLSEFAHRLGHKPVRCKDMPGFIVNHAGRGMNIEGLKIAQEGVADLADIDDIMREQGGFRMGPFELLDLTGLDVSHPVMETIYRQFYDEPRFRPSPITALRSLGGMLGRKSGTGFYRYIDGRKEVKPAVTSLRTRPKSILVSRANQRGHSMVLNLLQILGVSPEIGKRPTDNALIIVTPIGKDASACATEENLDPTRV
jgi:3-hydroxybutyryl-CoA dehydrogenase